MPKVSSNIQTRKLCSSLLFLSRWGHNQSHHFLTFATAPVFTAGLIFLEVPFWKKSFGLPPSLRWLSWQFFFVAGIILNNKDKTRPGKVITRTQNKAATTLIAKTFKILKSGTFSRKNAFFWELHCIVSFWPISTPSFIGNWFPL